LVTYAVTCAALPVFRHRGSAPAAAFRLPAGTLISIMSLLLAVWLLSNSTRAEARASVIAAAAGLVFYFLYRLARRGDAATI
jgi:ABC-type enterochelin transport system permease subunit